MEKKRFKITPAVYLVLIKENKILLLRRCNTGFHDSEYSFVAGHFDGKETARQAMVREAKEEAGINLGINNLKVIHVLNRLSKFNPEYMNERIDIFLQADS